MEIREKIAELERQLNELKSSLNEDNRPITERVKTFEDALDVLGDKHPFVKQWFNFIASSMDCGEPLGKDNADLYAYLKLRIITAALNEGWEPQFIEGEYRYYPWFALCTQEEWDELDAETKKRGVLFGGNAHYGATAGFVYAHSYAVPASSYAHFGSRLCFKSTELAEYAGKQFANLYADFYLNRR